LNSLIPYVFRVNICPNRLTGILFNFRTDFMDFRTSSGHHHLVVFLVFVFSFSLLYFICIVRYADFVCFSTVAVFCHCHLIPTAVHHHHFHYASLLSSTPDSKLTFSINRSNRFLPHLFGLISRIFKTISALSSSSIFLFISFQLFCLIYVID